MIYMNDLISFVDTMNDIVIEMYADDTVIYSSNMDVSIIYCHIPLSDGTRKAFPMVYK